MLKTITLLVLSILASSGHAKHRNGVNGTVNLTFMYQAISVKSFIKVQTIKENLPKSLHGSDFRKILKQDKKFRGLYLFMEAVELLS